MLKRLTLRDFAVVAASELEFGAGMTVISGETGADAVPSSALHTIVSDHARVDSTHIERVNVDKPSRRFGETQVIERTTSPAGEQAEVRGHIEE